jgi:hypothetical protein
MHQDMQNQQSYAPQTDGKNLQPPVQQHLPQQEILKTYLSVQAPCSTNSDTLKVATVVQQILTELIEGGTEEKIMVTTNLVLNLLKQYSC